MRTDLGDFEIPAAAEWIANCSYATTLMRTGVMLSTVEHLLAALRGAEIDNLYIEVDNLELPIMDGSAIAFTKMIEGAGIVEQSEQRRALKIKRKLKVSDGDRWIEIVPAKSFTVDCRIDFPHPLIGDSKFKLTHLSEFAVEVSSARTFGFTTEIEALRRANLIRGGSLESAIVLSPDGILNKEPLRFKNEFARHKTLDIIGDLALLGLPLVGRVTAYKSGHLLHSMLMTKLLRDDSAWEIVALDSVDSIGSDVRNSVEQQDVTTLVS